MKKTLIIVFMLFSAIAFTQTVELNKNLNLASQEFMMYKQQKKISLVFTLIGVGLITAGLLIPEHEGLIYIGGSAITMSFIVNFDSLSSLKRASKHLKD